MKGRCTIRRSLRLLCRVCLVLLFGALPAPSRAASNGEALLDHLVGHWHMTGTVRGKPVVYTLTAERTLQKRFVELHMKDVRVPPAYEARVFIGADSTGHRYIAH